MANIDVDVAVIGAGIGGLTAALALQRAGRSVAVFEQADRFGEVGAGIMLTPNASRVLIDLGLGERLADHGTRPRATVYRRYDNGEIMTEARVGEDSEARFGAPQYQIHRADLHDLLRRAVDARDPDCMRTGHALAEIAQRDGSAEVAFAHGGSVVARAVIGCDGIHSRTRAILIGAERPQFTGQVAYRGLVPASVLPDHMLAHASAVWIGPDRHVVQYAVRGGRLINFVAIVATERWEEEGWNIRAHVGELVDRFAGWHHDLISLLMGTPDGACFKWGLFDREPVERWSYGVVTLLGDAAHPMLPLMAQGAATAIEDGCVLARCLALPVPVAEALARYDRARINRTSSIVRRSRAAKDLYQRVTGDKAQERRAATEDVYAYDARLVPV
ncbi:MAG: FAD-dependent oxidoreductase [Rhodospirillaceae bacterium]|nr:FAD-dependent oxidoreductase [Rhodospirillaceae bacterium]